MNRRTFLGRAALVGSALPALGLAQDIRQRLSISTPAVTRRVAR